MLTEICAELKNYFCKEEDIIIGDFSIVGGAIVPSVNIAENQYYRIVGSVFNDGVHKYGDEADVLTDESEFHGAVWLMRVPSAVIQLAQDIQDWMNKYGVIDSENMSPYSSESFGGYSYSKAQGFAGSGGAMLNSWQAVFDGRLKPYRRIRVL